MYHQQVVYKSRTKPTNIKPRNINSGGLITVILIKLEKLGIAFGVRLRILSTMTHARSWRRSDNRRRSFVGLHDSLRNHALLELGLRGALSGISTQRVFQRFLPPFLEPERHGRLQRIDIQFVLDVFGKQVLGLPFPVTERLCRTLRA